MAAVQTRQPFGVLDNTRLQKLTSVKNCQNGKVACWLSFLAYSIVDTHCFVCSHFIVTAIQPSMSTSSPKPSLPGKRRLSTTAFEESEDSENIDPAIFNSPSKRSKNTDGAPVKSPRFTLNTSSAVRPTITAKKHVSLSVPTTTTTTPISASRGSPKHKRMGLLSKGRRASSSPFRRIDPPSFSTVIGDLPFSIDEALKGSIASYKPKAPAVAPAPPAVDVVPQQHMPKSWFFEIHEDTPEEEAANLMEHSASVLDISSDDDANTRRRDEEREKGKENIPPPEHLANIPAGNSSSAASGIQQDSVGNPVTTKAARSRKHMDPDAMVEDRAALGELPAQDFYADGLDASSNVIVAGDVISPQKPSGLSKEFDFAVPSPKGKLEAARREKGKAKAIDPQIDSQSKEIFICEDEL